MIIVILPQSAAELRLQVKRWGDITRGVATQCVVSVKFRLSIPCVTDDLGKCCSVNPRYGRTAAMRRITNIATMLQ
jgi:hypothetical protein